MMIYHKKDYFFSQEIVAKLSQAPTKLNWTELSLIVHFSTPPHPTEIVIITPYRKLKFGMLTTLDTTRRNLK